MPPRLAQPAEVRPLGYRLMAYGGASIERRFSAQPTPGGHVGGRLAGVWRESYALAFAAEWHSFTPNHPLAQATWIGGGLSYHIDLLPIRPYIGIDLGYMRLTGRSRGAMRGEIAPVLALGFDFWARWWLVGLGVRYFPRLQDGPLGPPGMVAVSLRIGLKDFGIRHLSSSPSQSTQQPSRKLP